MRIFKIYFLIGHSLFACHIAQDSPAVLFLGQGITAGEITDHSALLQTRTTRSDTLIEGDLEGRSGFVRFVWGLNQSLRESKDSSRWIRTDSTQDYITRIKIVALPENTKIYYQAEFGSDTLKVNKSEIGTFKTNPGVDNAAPITLAIVTGMNYYFHFYGNYDESTMYLGADRDLGYPALDALNKLKPDYFIGTGDNVYFDHPAEKNFNSAIKNGKKPHPGIFDGKEVTDEKGMRQKYHVQFVQPRFKQLFRNVGTYWEKDDHDYRLNDSDPYSDFPISHELGIKNFREQLPVVDLNDDITPTYRTHRMSKDIQLWFLEGRDYRSANGDPDGPTKTIWGTTQKEWLQKSLLESNATYKCIISPTPMVGPDDASKNDNHVNPDGFRYEGDRFFEWLTTNNFSKENLFIICGDRHWQYHARHPSGYEEFSTGALVDANSRAGRLAGDPKSTDPEGLITQYYVQGTVDQATGGFLVVKIIYNDKNPQLIFNFYDDMGEILYTIKK
ncbi:MAG: alkaline phosphatase D family protein [Saprospiraceae bacterium]|nr:alkaline phosphatase D family protein [Saprospiraceae bacterium]